jgi:hypothetical protein
MKATKQQFERAIQATSNPDAQRNHWQTTTFERKLLLLQQGIVERRIEERNRQADNVARERSIVELRRVDEEFDRHLKEAEANDKHRQEVVKDLTQRRAAHQEALRAANELKLEQQRVRREAQETARLKRLQEQHEAYEETLEGKARTLANSRLANINARLDKHFAEPHEVKQQSQAFWFNEVRKWKEKETQKSLAVRKQLARPTSSLQLQSSRPRTSMSPAGLDVSPGGSSVSLNSPSRQVLTPRSGYQAALREQILDEQLREKKGLRSRRGLPHRRCESASSSQPPRPKTSAIAGADIRSLPFEDRLRRVESRLNHAEEYQRESATQLSQWRSEKEAQRQEHLEAVNQRRWNRREESQIHHETSLQHVMHRIVDEVPAELDKSKMELDQRAELQYSRRQETLRQATLRQEQKKKKWEDDRRRGMQRFAARIARSVIASS